MFPKKRGLVSSLVMFANGCGPIAANTLSTMVVNPNNEYPTISVTQGHAHYTYFDSSISNRVPRMFLVLATCEAIIVAIALIFIYVPPKDRDRPQQRIPRNEASFSVSFIPQKQDHSVTIPMTRENLMHALKSFRFIASYGMMFFAIWYFFFMAISFKSYGASAGLNDQFLTFAGSFAAIINALSRIFIGSTLDYAKFKHVFGLVLLVQIVLAVTFPYIVDQKWLFFVWLCFTNIVQGSIFVSVTTLFAKMFGPDIGSQAFSYFFTSYSISGLVLAMTVLFFQNALGFSGMLTITAALSAISLVFLCFVNETRMNFAETALIDTSLNPRDHSTEA